MIEEIEMQLLCNLVMTNLINPVILGGVRMMPVFKKSKIKNKTKRLKRKKNKVNNFLFNVIIQLLKRNIRIQNQQK